MSERDTATADALAAPFEPREVKFKPQSVKNNRCLAMAYIDARLIMDRLDDVMGVENWTDEYVILNDGSVMCVLKVRFGDIWVSKSDVGSPSEQPDSGDRLKAAFSDALKRAAVKFGIGRYLYRLAAQWVDYDPTKKQIVSPPQLPAWALPKGKGAPPATTKPAAQQPAPLPVSPANKLTADLTAADTEAKLKTAWLAWGEALKAKRVTQEQYNAAIIIKDERKAALAKKAAPKPTDDAPELDEHGNPVLFGNAPPVTNLPG